MRLRNIPGADEAIANNPLCIQNPEALRGKWADLFENRNPIRIEVGMGKGRFLLGLAAENPDCNYIGLERYTSVLLRATQKIEQRTEAPANLRFICMNAELLPEIFSENEVDRIYLNFSDPWPKERHARRRLTSRDFLSRYNSILKPDGKIEFKTDNRILFDFSIREIKESGWNIVSITYDLHKDPVMNQNNIMTEYEEKFSSLGNPIYKRIASRG